MAGRTIRAVAFLRLHQMSLESQALERAAGIGIDKERRERIVTAIVAAWLGYIGKWRLPEGDDGAADATIQWAGVWADAVIADSDARERGGR